MKFLKIKKWKIKDYWLPGIALFIGLGVVGYVAYQPIAVKKDRARFAAAEATFDDFVKEVENRIGKADQQEIKRSCDRPNLKYEKGPLSCSVDIYLLYENKGHEEANRLKDEVVKISGQEVKIASGAARVGGFVPTSEQRGNQDFIQGYGHIREKSCSIFYRYPVQKSSFEFFRPVSSENLGIVYGCEGPAKAEHFPIDN